MNKDSITHIKLRSFESKVLYFNGMYKLPVAPYPSAFAVAHDEEKKAPLPKPGIMRELVAARLLSFKKTLSDELNEIDLIVENLLVKPKTGELSYASEDLLTDLADLLGDLQVYCASEMVKFGLPVNEVLSIIMESNFSKLQADGTTKYDKDGKVLKGPHYWKPEPQIKLMLESCIKENS